MEIESKQNVFSDAVLDASLEADLVITMKGIYKIEELIK